MNLRAYRSRYALSQADLADRLGVTRQAVSHYEVGRWRPRPSVIIRIVAATAGEVTANDLLGLTSPSAPPEAK